MPARSTVVATEVRTIQAALRQVLQSLDRLLPALTAPSRLETTPKRTLQLSPARRKALKLHGQYLGNMHGLNPKQRTQVKKIRAAKGVRAAIAAAKRLSSRS